MVSWSLSNDSATAYVAPSFQRFGFSERPARTCWTMRCQVSLGQVQGSDCGSDCAAVVMMVPSAVVLEAVDRERLAGDEAGLGGGEEHDDLGDVVGFAEPPQRNVSCRDLRPAAACHRIAK